MLILSSCAGAPKLTPHFLDTQLKEMREYEVIDKTTLTIKFKARHPMDWGKNTYGNGFFCIPPDEPGLWKAYCLKHKCLDKSFMEE